MSWLKRIRCAGCDKSMRKVDAWHMYGTFGPKQGFAGLTLSSDHWGHLDCIRKIHDRLKEEFG